MCKKHGTNLTKLNNVDTKAQRHTQKHKTHRHKAFTRGDYMHIAPKILPN